MWTCLGGEAKVKIDATDQCTEATNELITVARGASSPQVPARGEVLACRATSPQVFACDGVIVALGYELMETLLRRLGQS
jgi:hypothetical protein